MPDRVAAHARGGPALGLVIAGCMHPLASAPDVRTPYPTVRALLDGRRHRKDVVYDLGSGDGRIVITAAREFGARGVGVEIDPALVAESRAPPGASGYPRACASSSRISSRRISARLPSSRSTSAPNQPQAPAEAPGRTQAGQPDRLPRLRHGRLAARPRRARAGRRSRADLYLWTVFARP